MGWVRHKSGKQKFVMEKHFWQDISSSIIYSILLIFIITTKTKQLKNEIKWNKRNQT